MTTSGMSGTGSAGSIGARASPRRPSGALLAELRDRPLFAHVVEHNIGSIRVLEKCGFSNVGSVVLPNEEGTEFLYRLGDPQDSATIA